MATDYDNEYFQCDSSSSTSTDELAVKSWSFRKKLHQLTMLFPDRYQDDLSKILKSNHGNYDLAMNFLLENNRLGTKMKNIIHKKEKQLKRLKEVKIGCEKKERTKDNFSSQNEVINVDSDEFVESFEDMMEEVELFYCPLCFGNFSREISVSCNSGCLFCNACLVKKVQVLVNKNNNNPIDCFLKCGETFSNTILRYFLPPILYKKIKANEVPESCTSKDHKSDKDLKRAIRVGDFNLSKEKCRSEKSFQTNITKEIISQIDSDLQLLALASKIDPRDLTMAFSFRRTSENPYHNVNEATKNAEIIRILKNVLVNFVKMERLEIPPHGEIWDLLEGSALIPFLEIKMSCSNFFNIETKVNFQLNRVILELVNKMRDVFPIKFCVLPSIVKIRFNLCRRINEETIFKMIQVNGFVDLQPSYALQGDDPQVLLFHFLKMTVEQKAGVGNSNLNNFTLKNAKYYQNNRLSARFEECKRKLKSSGFPTNEKLLFHGTNADTNSIFENGFRMKYVKRTAYGFGIYFSDYVQTCIGYSGSRRMIMSRVLMGNANCVLNNTGVGNGYQSKAISLRPSGTGLSDIIVIDKEEQILPIFQFDV